MSFYNILYNLKNREKKWFIERDVIVSKKISIRLDSIDKFHLFNYALNRAKSSRLDYIL